MPQETGCAQLGRFHEEVHANRKEEAKAWSKFIHVHARSNRGAHIFAPICQGEGQFLNQVRTSFLHVVARDRD